MNSSMVDFKVDDRLCQRFKKSTTLESLSLTCSDVDVCDRNVHDLDLESVSMALT